MGVLMSTIKVENTVHSLAMQTTAYVFVGTKTVEVRTVDLPRDVVVALCDRFKEQMLEMYDNSNKKLTAGEVQR
jgi:hypothetical protein